MFRTLFSSRSAVSRSAGPLLVAALWTLSGCIDNTGVNMATLSGASPTPTGTGTSTQNSNIVISSVNIVSSGPQSSTATLLFVATKTPISTVCSAPSGNTTTKPCNCRFSWQDAANGSSVPVTHVVTNSVTLVQPNTVSCAGPAYFSTEIKNKTTIRVTVVPAPANPQMFTIAEASFIKTADANQGSFSDNRGNVFDNILRYSCYEQYKRGMEIKNSSFPYTNATTAETRNIMRASSFCIAKAAGGTTGQGCDTANLLQDYSAQAYYKNIYIRDSRRGEANISNENYVCPQVNESLWPSNESKGKFWPMDTSFALSVAKTPDYPIGIEAFETLNTGDLSTSVPTSCTATAPPPAPAGGLVSKCLGFAAKVNVDNTCPAIRDSHGMVVSTYRLRRFVAIYPPMFDTDGKLLPQPQEVDTVYILDRPVTAAAADPLKPWTMYGPKPCPFAYYDNKNVLKLPRTDQVNQPGSYYTNANFYNPMYTGLPSKTLPPVYVATNDPIWSAAGTNSGWGVNVDGIELPNTDSPKSCAAALPLYNFTSKWWSIGTVYSGEDGKLGAAWNKPAGMPGHLYVRPSKSWAPHYVEDTAFRACAPLSVHNQVPTIIDPPLHFQKDSQNNVGWCAEAYPTQNSHVDKLETQINVTKAGGGSVVAYTTGIKPYTSHVIKGLQNAAIQCNYSSLASTLNTLNSPKFNLDGPASRNVRAIQFNPAAAEWSTTGAISDPHTCDRTVQYASVGSARFPLLAAEIDVENAIKNDISGYGCLISYDAGNGKMNKYAPSGGCCGPVVKVKPGPTAVGDFNSAHLEPTFPCGTPAY